MHFRRISSVVTFLGLLSGCGSDNDMTVRQATAVLNEYFARNPETSKVLTGMNDIGTQPVSDHWYTWYTPDGRYQKALEAAGLVTITAPKGKIYNLANHNQWMYALDVRLTEPLSVAPLWKKMSTVLVTRRRRAGVLLLCNGCSTGCAGVCAEFDRGLSSARRIGCTDLESRPYPVRASHRTLRIQCKLTA